MDGGREDVLRDPEPAEYISKISVHVAQSLFVQSRRLES